MVHSLSEWQFSAPETFGQQDVFANQVPYWLEVLSKQTRRTNGHWGLESSKSKSP